MKYKLIIFDFDGTLADTFPWFAENINRAAAVFRFKKISTEDHEQLRKLTAREVLSFLNISWWKIPLVAIYMRRKMSRDLSKIKLFENVELLLSSLREKNIQLAIVSSNSEENIKSILGSSMNHFEIIKCSSSLFGKPKKFKTILKEAGHLPQEVLCIGDEIRDIEAAHSVNAHAGAVCWGYADPDSLKSRGPAYLFKRVEDILVEME